MTKPYKTRITQTKKARLEEEMPSWTDAKLLIFSLIVGVISYLVLNNTFSLNLDIVAEILSIIFFSILPVIVLQLYYYLKIIKSIPETVYEEQQKEISVWKRTAGVIEGRNSADLELGEYRQSSNGETQIGINIRNQDGIDLDYCSLVFRNIAFLQSENELSTTQQLVWGGMNDKKGEVITIPVGQSEVAVVAEIHPGSSEFHIPFQNSRGYPPGLYDITIIVQGVRNREPFQNIILIEVEYRGETQMWVNEIHKLE